jgi:4-amino-4-deoxy-L-arabinose transferase-like glycosyltransferase
MSKYYDYIVVLSLVVLTSFFVLYRLGEGSLKPWDEAWYGVVTRNLLQPGSNWLKLEYNQKPFLDHPPLGFYLKAASVATFGQTTFAMRLPEAITGVMSVVLVYLIGRRLSSRWAGVWGALILLSSRWFLFRARSGNLDVLLLGTQLLVLLGLSMLITAQPKKDAPKAVAIGDFITFHKWLWFTWLVWSLSILAKSLISLQLAPVVGLVSLYYWQQTGYAVKSRETFWLAVGAVAWWAVPLAVWAGYLFFVYRELFVKMVLTIGFRSGTKKELAWSIVKLTIEYFHAAVNKWFKVMAVSGLLAGVLAFISPKRAVFVTLLAYLFLVAFPYFISVKTEIWHLIPVIGAMAVLSGIALDEAINQAEVLATWLVKQYKLAVPQLVMKNLGVLSKSLLTIAVVMITASSLKNYWPEFLEVTIYPDDYQKITTHLQHRNITLYTTMDAYFPGIVYYADLHDAAVEYLRQEGFGSACTSAVKNNQPFQVVARYGDWMMERTQDTYVVKREGDLVLIEIAPEECKKLIERIDTVKN